MLSPHDLATLIAVADAGSIHRAALVLHRTQPAVTQAIQRLEEAVGFALLDRSGYRAKLTERGDSFVKRARATMQQAQDLAAFAGVLSQGVEARLRVAVHGAMPNALALDLVRGMAECFPDTSLELERCEGEAPLRRLLDDDCQLAAIISPAAQHRSPDIESKLLSELEFVTVAHASRCSPSVEEGLPSIPQVIVADFADPATSYGVVLGHRAWRVSDHRMKAAAISAGCGWGSVPAHLVEAELRDGTLQRVAYRGLQPSSRHPVLLCRRRDRARGPAAAFIWDAVGDDKPGCSSR